jgi:hypothetical protein
MMRETKMASSYVKSPLNELSSTALSRRRRGFKSRWGRQDLADRGKAGHPAVTPFPGGQRRRQLPGSYGEDGRSADRDIAQESERIRRRSVYRAAVAP